MCKYAQVVCYMQIFGYYKVPTYKGRRVFEDLSTSALEYLSILVRQNTATPVFGYLNMWIYKCLDR